MYLLWRKQEHRVGDFMLNDRTTVKRQNGSGQYIDIPHQNGSFSVDRNFSVDSIGKVRPPISRIHPNFDWFEGLRERPLQAARLTYQRIESGSEISLATVLPKTYLYQVYHLMQIQRIGKQRPLSYTEPNIFLILDARCILRELQLIWWNKGWAVEPEVFGKKPLSIGARFFSEVSLSAK